MLAWPQARRWYNPASGLIPRSQRRLIVAGNEVFDGPAHAELSRFSMPSKLQNEFRSWLGAQTNFPFRENIRPDWLISEFGERCELDFYVERLRLAVEIQGIQHYRFTPHFHRSYDDFVALQRRDEFKRVVCAAMGIKLFLVHDTSEFDEVSRYIVRYDKPELDGTVFLWLKAKSRRFCLRWEKHAKLVDRYHGKRLRAVEPNAIAKFDKLLRIQEHALMQLFEAFRPQILEAMRRTGKRKTVA